MLEDKAKVVYEKWNEFFNVIQNNDTDKINVGDIYGYIVDLEIAIAEMREDLEYEDKEYSSKGSENKTVDELLDEFFNELEKGDKD